MERVRVLILKTAVTHAKPQSAQRKTIDPELKKNIAKWSSFSPTKAFGSLCVLCDFARNKVCSFE